MYALRQIQDFKNCEQFQALFSDLPKRPYCTNAKGFCYFRNKNHAIKHAYIQPNTPFVARWLVFDIDHPQALFAFYDNDAPRPHLIIKNPKNGHAHYCYRLAKPVGLTGKSSIKAIKYLEAIYNALRCKLGADMGYSGNLIKNPAHGDWQSFTVGQTAPYTLDELAEYLDLTKPTKKRQAINDESWYFGRNHEVFERTRHQAYPIADQYGYNELYNQVLAIASNENDRFRYPLSHRELHHIAKSITRFCKSSKFGAYSVDFREKQRQRAYIANANGANSKGGKARSAKYDDKREQAKRLRQQGLSMAKIAQELGTHKTQIARWLKSQKIVHIAAKSDNSHFHPVKVGVCSVVNLSESSGLQRTGCVGLAITLSEAEGEARPILNRSGVKRVRDSLHIEQL